MAKYTMVIGSMTKSVEMVNQFLFQVFIHWLMAMNTKENLEMIKNKEEVLRIVILGVLNYNNNEKYDGEWKNDLKDGKGIYQ